MKQLFAILMLCSSSLVFSQSIITDRPDQTESSSTIPVGRLQVESGLLLEHRTEEGLNIRQWLLPTTLFRYGLIDWLELRIVSQIESNRYNEYFRTSGFSDLEFGTKIQILQKENLNTEVAFLSHLILPTGNRGIGSNAYGNSSRVLISHQINDRTSIGYNLGYSIMEEEEDGIYLYTLSLGRSVTEKTSLYIETYGEYGESLVASFDAGFTYQPRYNLQFDFSFGTGINHRMNYASIGISWLSPPYE